MTHNDDLQACLARVVRVFNARPETALSSSQVRATLRDGLTVRTDEDGHVLYADMPEVFGGSAEHASPGVLGRACIASCIAIGVKFAAARRGIVLDSIEVEMSMDWDHRGMVGDKRVYPGPENIRVQIDVASEAPEDAVRAAVADGLESDPWLLALERPHAVATRIAVSA